MDSEEEDNQLESWLSDTNLDLQIPLSNDGSVTRPSPDIISEGISMDSSLGTFSVSEIPTSVTRAINQGTNLLIECPQTLDRPVRILQTALISYLEHFKGEKVIPKIYLAVESFQDVGITLKILKEKLSSDPILKNLKLTALGSRKALCVNEEVNSRQISEIDLEERCFSLVQNYNVNTRFGIQDTAYAKETCLFYPNTQPFSFIEGNVVADIEDLISSTKELNSCPFYSSKKSHSEANIVVLPVEYLLSPILRRENGIDLNNSILIVDNGFDLETNCFRADSVIMSRADLVRARLALEEILNSDGLDPAISTLFRKLLDPLKSLADWVRKNVLEERHPEKEVILDQIKALGINAQNINLICDALHALPAQPNADISNYKELQKLKLFFTTALTADNNPDDYHLEVRYAKSEGGEEHPSLVMNCGSAAFTLSHVEGPAKSLIVGGSCLSPLGTILTGLGIEFHEKLRVAYESDDPIKDIYFMGYCDTGPSGVRYALGFRNRADEAIMLEVIKAILELSKVIPNGVVIKFNCRNYFKLDFMHFLRVDEEATGILEEIKRLKYFVNELALTPENEEVEIQKFKEMSREPREDFNGAIIFVDGRGPLLKKMDLVGKEIRGNINVSIAYGNWYHGDYIIAKRKVLESSGNLNNEQDNRNWYSCEAFRRTNQSFAECVKGRDDWGIVIILDYRMAMKSSKFGEYLPAWVTKMGLMREFKFNELSERVKKFVEMRFD